MKQIYITLTTSILLSFLCFQANGQETYGIEFKSDFISAYFLPNDDSSYYYLINLNLINRSNSKLEFVTNSCTPGMNVVWDTSELKLLVNCCNSTFPSFLTLNPKQNFSFTMVFQTKQNSPIIGKPLKFGFILLQPKLVKSQDYYKLVAKMSKSYENVMWSKPITLYPTSFKPWEIRELNGTSK